MAQATAQLEGTATNAHPSIYVATAGNSVTVELKTPPSRSRHGAFPAGVGTGRGDVCVNEALRAHLERFPIGNTSQYSAYSRTYTTVIAYLRGRCRRNVDYKSNHTPKARFQPSSPDWLTPF